MKDRPLSCKIEDDELVIRIGIERLEYCTEHCGLFVKMPGLYNEPFCKVVDSIALANDVCYSLGRENEVGQSILSDCFDRASLDAYYNGSIGFDYKFKPKIIR